MLKYFTILFTSVFLILSCKTKAEKNGGKAATTDTTASFPIIELLQNDADEVAKTPYYLYKKNADVKTNKWIDSVVLSREDFKKIIAPIIKIDISSAIAKENFKETSFHDLSTKSYSVILSSLKPNAELQSITALFNDETNKLKNAFIVLQNNSNDTSYIKKYFWKAGKSLSIATAVSYQNKIVKETKQFINWNDKDLQ